MSGETSTSAIDALVFDTSVLSAFADAGRLDMLAYHLADRPCYTTDIVRQELKNGAATRSRLAALDSTSWLMLGDLNDDAGLLALLRWTELLGAGVHDFGEASVFAYAELHRGIAVTDDRAATAVARRERLRVHGSLWLISGFCNAGKLTEYAAARMVDDLHSVGARLPCTGTEFAAWARDHGLLRARELRR